MYLDEDIKIDKSILPTQLAEEVEMMDGFYYNNDECKFAIKKNEIYHMAKWALMDGRIDGNTCKNIWDRYGLVG